MIELWAYIIKKYIGMFNDLKNYIRSLIFWRTNMYWNVWPKIVFIKIMHNLTCLQLIAGTEQAESKQSAREELFLHFVVTHE